MIHKKMCKDRKESLTIMFKTSLVHLFHYPSSFKHFWTPSATSHLTNGHTLENEGPKFSKDVF